MGNKYYSYVISVQVGENNEKSYIVCDEEMMLFNSDDFGKVLEFLRGCEK